MRPSGLQPEMIVLVDEHGNPVGEAEKDSSHHSDTPLHLAFSCYVFDGRGRLLVTKRAAGKKVWPGVWSNSVCGHPMPGEDIVSAIRRRLDHELGITADELRAALEDYRYRSPEFAGVVENEYCPVYLARATSVPTPNRAEVEHFMWMPWGDFVRAAEADKDDGYSWWCKDQLRRLKNHPLVSEYVRPLETSSAESGSG